MNKKLIFEALLVLVLTLVLSACGAQAEPTPASSQTIIPSGVIAEGHFIPRDNLYLSFPVRGRVAEILVEKGQHVNKGDVLIRLGDREQAEAAVAAANFELTSAQQAYDDFIRNASFNGAVAWQDYLKAQMARAEAQKTWDALNIDNIDNRIDDADADVQDKKTALEDAQKEFDKYVDLNENNATRKRAKDALDKAQEDYDNALIKKEEVQREKDGPRAALDQALAAEAEAKRKFEASLDGPDAEKLALVEARLKNARAQVAAAENGLSNYDLTAPFAGDVADVNLSVDEWAGPETWAVALADFSQWYVETSDLTELDVVDVAVGQKVTIVADALPNVKMTGVVEEISQIFKSQGGDILYTVRIRVDDVDPAVRWGMTVEVTFEPMQ